MKRLALITVLSSIGCITAACSLSPMPNCKEGQFTCEPEENGDGGALFQCKNDDNVYIKNCAFGCHANRSGCAAPSLEKCESGTRLCTDEHTLKQCDNDTWKLFECEDSCTDGACTIHECTDTEPATCSDDYTVVSCIEGQIQKTECSENQKCVQGNCIDIASYDPSDDKEICDDGIDNDKNGKADCDDPACNDDMACQTTTPPNPQDPKEICNDKKDNDDNGLIDCDDPECKDLQACKTTTPPDPETQKEICGDGIDNDKNGKTDCDDPACKDNITCQTKEICDDNKDNDKNGMIDCDDPTCKDLPQCIPIEGCDDACQNCKKESDTFTICSGKGILEYQKLTKEERKELKTLNFKGEINLNDAGKTTTPDKSSETPCEWADWTPLQVPDGIQIIGDKAHIFYQNADKRCTLPDVFFDTVSRSAQLSNMHFDYDYYGMSSAVLIRELAGVTVNNLTYTGSAISTGNKLNFALIDRASSNQAETITINLHKMHNKNTSENSINGMDIAGFIGVSGSNEIRNLELNVDEMFNYTKGGIGGLIGTAKDYLTLEHIKIHIKEIQVAEKHDYIGGLIQNITYNNDITIDDSYIQIDQIKRNTAQSKPDIPGTEDYGIDIISGAMIGDITNASSNYSLNISNCILHIKEISKTLLSGIFGNMASQSYKLNNIVMISDSTLHGGLVGNDVQYLINTLNWTEILPFFGKSIQNVVFVSPSSTCDDMILNHCSSDIASNMASMLAITGNKTPNISNSFFYNSFKCPEELFLFKGYNAHTKSIIDLLQTSSSASWELRQVNMGKYTLEVPLFKAAGVWAN